MSYRRVPNDARTSIQSDQLPASLKAELSDISRQVARLAARIRKAANRLA